MAPRRYDRRRRDEAMAAVRARIVDAVVELHAEIGPSRTTYAMIAQKADVAIPTVYKHFPTLAGIFAACVGHVSAQVPALTMDIFAGCNGTPERLAALAHELFERHRHFAPWLRWSRREAHLLPDMAVYFTKMRERQMRLIHEALKPAYGARPPARVAALVEVLTGFDAWQTLTGENALSAAEAEAAAADAMRALIDGARPGRLPRLSPKLGSEVERASRPRANTPAVARRAR